MVVVVVFGATRWHTLPLPSTRLHWRALQQVLVAQDLPRDEHFCLMHMVRLLLETLPPVHFLQRRRPLACVIELTGQRLQLLPPLPYIPGGHGDALVVVGGVVVPADF